MVDTMMDKSCTDFAAALAAKTSVPGGGGAAAYVGALAVALCNMAGNFTVGKQEHAVHEDDLQRMLACGKEVRIRLLELVEEDAVAFRPLAHAYRMPKEDPTRSEVLETCTKEALVAPLEMMRQLTQVVELLEEMYIKGSRLLVSDVGCGAACAAAAMQAAALNVFVNTRNLQDQVYAEKVEVEVDKLLAYVARAKAIADKVTEDIRS